MYEWDLLVCIVGFGMNLVIVNDIVKKVMYVEMLEKILFVKGYYFKELDEFFFLDGFYVIVGVFGNWDNVYRYLNVVLGDFLEMRLVVNERNYYYYVLLYNLLD